MHQGIGFRVAQHLGEVLVWLQGLSRMQFPVWEPSVWRTCSGLQVVIEYQRPHKVTDGDCGFVATP